MVKAEIVIKDICYSGTTSVMLYDRIKIIIEAKNAVEVRAIIEKLHEKIIK